MEPEDRILVLLLKGFFEGAGFVVGGRFLFVDMCVKFLDLAFVVVLLHLALFFFLWRLCRPAWDCSGFE